MKHRVLNAAGGKLYTGTVRQFNMSPTDEELVRFLEHTVGIPVVSSNEVSKEELPVEDDAPVEDAAPAEEKTA